MGRYIILAIAFFFLPIGTSTAALHNDNAPPVSRETRIRFERYIEMLVSKGEYDKAITLFNAVITQYPRYHLLYLKRGLIHRHKGDYARAIADFTRAYGLCPTDTCGCALFNRGITHFFLEKFDLAEADFRQRLALTDDALVVFNRILLYFSMAFQGKDGSAVLKDLDKAADRSAWPGPIVQMLLGQITASEVIELAQDSDPAKTRENLCEAFYYTGVFYKLQGKIKKAKAMFSECARTEIRHYNEYDGAIAEINGNLKPY